MNNAAEVLETCQKLGAEVRVEGSNLKVTSPTPLPPAVLAALKEHKQELLAQLATTPANSQPADTGQAELFQRLQVGQTWLSTTWAKLAAQEKLADSMNDRFLEGLDRWARMEQLLRELYGWQGCALGEGQTCNHDSPIVCRACAGSTPLTKPPCPECGVASPALLQSRTVEGWTRLQDSWRCAGCLHEWTTDAPLKGAQ